MLTFDQIKELIELVGNQKLQGLEVERSGFRLRIDGQSLNTAPAAPAPVVVAMAPEPPVSAVPAVVSEVAAPPPEPAVATPAEESFHQLNSPIVGTFYRSPAPESPSFTEVGSRVEKGQVLCIVEAMKLMNEIECDVNGVVVEVFPKNAQPVEFGEPLFAIRPD